MTSYARKENQKENNMSYLQPYQLREMSEMFGQKFEPNNEEHTGKLKNILDEYEEGLTEIIETGELSEKYFRNFGLLETISKFFPNLDFQRFLDSIQSFNFSYFYSTSFAFHQENERTRLSKIINY